MRDYGGETLQELKTTKTWLGQKVVGPGYAICEQWFFFGGKFSSLGNKKNRVRLTQSICVKVFLCPQKCPKVARI